VIGVDGVLEVRARVEAHVGEFGVLTALVERGRIVLLVEFLVLGPDSRGRCVDDDVGLGDEFLDRARDLEAGLGEQFLALFDCRVEREPLWIAVSASKFGRVFATPSTSMSGCCRTASATRLPIVP